MSEETAMKIGIWELVVIFVIALVVIGPDQFPDFARRLGKGLREFRKATDEVTKEFRENVSEPLSEAGKPLKEALEPLQEAAQEIQAVDRTIKNAGKPGGFQRMVKDAALKPQADSAGQTAEPVDSVPAEASESQSSGQTTLEKEAGQSSQVLEPEPGEDNGNTA